MAQWSLLIVLFCVATAVAGLSFQDSNPIRMVSDMEEQLLQVIGESRHAVSFVRFANRYGKRYDTVDEMKRRFKIFSENLELIKSTNKKRLSYTLGVNRMYY
jgi:cathepsin H